MSDQRPRILVFTGDGKGKTTAALGMAWRFLGHGKSVLLVRFCKNRPSGETLALAAYPGALILNSTRGMTPPPDHPDYPEHREAARSLLAEAAGAAAKFDLVVFDEVCGAIKRGLLEEASVLAFLDTLASFQTLACTGRGASLGLLARADTASDIIPLKHAYGKGIPAQEGVEF